MRNKEGLKTHAISGFFVFLLIALFALMSVVLVLIGTQAYQRVADASLSSADGQMIVSYLLGKLRSCDSDGAISVRDMDGTQVLCLSDGDYYDEERYETRIYYYDGAICEQYTMSDSALNRDLGQPLIEARGMSFSRLGKGLIQVSVFQQDGRENKLSMAVRSEGGVGE